MTPWLLAGTSHAHQPGLSFAQVQDGQLTLVFSEAELSAYVELADLAAATPYLDATFTARALVTADGRPCPAGPPVVDRVEKDGLRLQSTHPCAGAKTWTFEAGYLADLAPGHRQVLEGFGSPRAVLDAHAPVASFEGAATHTGASTVAGQFLGLGVEHILTGYDHLLFLVGLLLVAKSLRQMGGIVTGFTLAHSVTLSLAALGVVRISPDLVEPAIALSVAWVGIENLWDPPARRRFVLTSLLGLVHGFGFAAMLTEIGIPQSYRVLALGCFNLGVELGQLAVVAVVLPGLLALGNHERWKTYGVPSASVGVAVVGIAWFLERVLL